MIDNVVFRGEGVTVRRGDVAWSSKDGRFIAARVGFREVGRTFRMVAAYTAIDTVERSVLYPWHDKREAIADAKKPRIKGGAMSDRCVTPAVTYAAIVGAAIVQLRERHGTTQADCAAAMNLAPSTWSRIERGTSALTVEQLARFAAYVRCAPSDVLILADERRDEITSRGVAVLLDRVSATEAMARGHALVSAATLAEFFAPR